MKNIPLRIYTLLIVGIFLLILWINRPVTDVEEVFLIPAEFEGCVWIYYNQPEAEALRIENKKIVYRIPDNGVFSTSSSPKFGNLGFHKIRAFYVNEQGERIEEIPPEKHNYGSLRGQNHSLSQSSWKLFDTSRDFCQ